MQNKTRMCLKVFATYPILKSKTTIQNQKLQEPNQPHDQLIN